jgi:GNAT superfamily N-acetyltransferase
MKVDYKNYKVRRAYIKDIDILVSHHKKMCEEILTLENNMTNIDLYKMTTSYYTKLAKHLTNNSCIAFVVELDNKVVAGGALTVIETVPIPDCFDIRVGYVHSIYTEKEYRRNGFAKIVIEELIKYADKIGIKRFQLQASSAGKGLYEKLGFKTTQMMSLRLS